MIPPSQDRLDERQATPRRLQLPEEADGIRQRQHPAAGPPKAAALHPEPRFRPREGGEGVQSLQVHVHVGKSRRPLLPRAQRRRP